MTRPRDSILGTTVAGRFRILEEIGEGANGVVYRAEHPSLKRQYAVKILKASLQQDARLVERFRREALAASRLEHPSIISIEDFGRTEEGLFYLVMEHAPGRSLQDVLDENHPELLPYHRVLHILSQVADALGTAHDAGIIHRDVKPGNIMVCPTASGADRVMMLDFGLAKITMDSDLSALTRQGEIFGTPAYMSPEQAAGEPTDSRTDIYSFGVLAYELLAGRLPVQGTSLPQIIIAHQMVIPPDVNQVRPSGLPTLDSDLAALIMSCLAKDRDTRPDRMTEIRRVLDRCRTGLRTLDRLRESVVPPPDVEPSLRRSWMIEETSAIHPGEQVLAFAPTAIRGDALQLGRLSASASVTGTVGAREHRWNELCRLARDLGMSMLRWAPNDMPLSSLLEDVFSQERALVDAETELAIGQNEAEEMEVGYREREALLRHAITDLSVDRARLLEDPSTDQSLVPDLTFQIEQLETRLAEVFGLHAEEDSHLQLRLVDHQAKIDTLRRQLTALDLRLMTELGSRRPGANAPRPLQEAYVHFSELMATL